MGTDDVFINASLSNWTLRKKKAFLGIVILTCVSKHDAVFNIAGHRLGLGSFRARDFEAYMWQCQGKSHSSASISSDNKCYT